ncbi:MAG: hypothetical protein PHC66_00200 [Candidatus Nanoarchaeia archaeon]|nr:hypothetical protein [Candidatus Nanoarchaeia archaeon]MDD5239630.1 hypothetical protein [Candidatus Nanoarchaeia archaeon]
MDEVSAKINQVLGVYPDNLERRVAVAMSAAVIAAVFVLMGLLYTFTSFRTSILPSAGSISVATYASRNIGYFLMGVYALTIGSLVYFVFLPWKSKIKKY